MQSPNMPFANRVRLVFLAILPLTTVACASAGKPSHDANAYDAYAIRYATLPNFPIRALIAGADSSRRIDIGAGDQRANGKVRQRRIADRVRVVSVRTFP